MLFTQLDSFCDIEDSLIGYLNLSTHDDVSYHDGLSIWLKISLHDERSAY